MPDVVRIQTLASKWAASLGWQDPPIVDILKAFLGDGVTGVLTHSHIVCFEVDSGWVI